VCVPLGIEPPLHRRRVDFWTKSRAFSIDKARRVLGYAPQVDLDEGVARTVAAYRQAGWL
jgi:dihydroflavonol-4-reductase